MKRFWIGLLSIALVMIFSASVFAADAKFSGEFYLKGWYNKNHSLIDVDSPTGTSQAGVGRGSTAFYTQRLRMAMDFQIAKGLRFYTRFDALERKWMAARRNAPTGDKSPSITTTDSEAENIAWEAAYVQFATPLGLFTVGGVPSGGCFGPCFGDAVGFTGNVISWANSFGKWSLSASMKKSQDGVWSSGTAPSGPTRIGEGTDNDSETYTIATSTRWPDGRFGMAIGDVRSRTANVTYTSSSIPGLIVYGRKTELPYISVWAMQKFGKLFAEWEAGMIHFGHYLKYNEPKLSPLLRDVKPYYAWSTYFNVNYDLSPAKVGFMFIYSSGDDPNTPDKREGGFRGILDLDRSFNPCLILWNEDYMQWMSPTGSGGSQTGTIYGNATGNPISTPMNNMWFYQIYGDFKATPKLTLGAAFTYAYAAKKPTHNGNPTNDTIAPRGVTFLSDEYGKELDITMKYKIYDNLEYMIGAAYLWTGDYFKGTNAATKLSNNYLITHKLTLTF